jgi:small subunit ribosomal protein S17
MAKKEKIGIVCSTQGNKTISVSCTKVSTDLKYLKSSHKTTRFMVHDKNNICNVGDMVEVVECRPISKMKHWTLKSIKKTHK